MYYIIYIYKYTVLLCAHRHCVAPLVKLMLMLDSSSSAVARDVAIDQRHSPVVFDNGPGGAHLQTIRHSPFLLSLSHFLFIFFLRSFIPPTLFLLLPLFLRSLVLCKGVDMQIAAIYVQHISPSIYYIYFLTLSVSFRGQHLL